jgi:hypothetical protein
MTGLRRRQVVEHRERCAARADDPGGDDLRTAGQAGTAAAAGAEHLLQHAQVQQHRAARLVELDRRVVRDHPVPGALDHRNFDPGEQQALVGLRRVVAGSAAAATAAAGAHGMHPRPDVLDPYPDRRAVVFDRQSRIEVRRDQRRSEQQHDLRRGGDRRRQGRRDAGHLDRVAQQRLELRGGDDRAPFAVVESAQPGHELPQHVFFVLVGRREAQFEREVVHQPRRRHQLVLGAAWCAGDRHELRRTVAIAERQVEIDRPRRGIAEDLRDLGLVRVEPVLQIGALGRLHAHELAARRERAARRHGDARPLRRHDLGLDAQPAERAVADRVARQPAVAAGEIGELLVKVVHAEHHPEGVIDVLGRIGGFGLERRGHERVAGHRDPPLIEGEQPQVEDERPVCSEPSQPEPR